MKKKAIKTCPAIELELDSSSRQLMKKYIPTLKKISDTQDKDLRNKLISKLPREGLDIFCKCCYNVLYFKNLKRSARKRLQKLPITTKTVIRYLALKPKSKNIRKKRHFMKQSGGSITAIIATILPLISSLISKYV